ncbi:MAG TPA: phosphatidate cytidylyltransferase [Bryobacteraceae bacterium]|jgi:phosphatidate cytidylyltransferase
MVYLTEVYWIFGCLFAVASLASAVGYILARRAPANRARQNLNARIRSWWVMILVGGASLLAGRIAVILLFAFLSFLSLREFLTQAPGRRADHSALFACFFIALPVQYLLIAIDWYGLFSIWIPVYAFLVLPVLAALFSDTERFLDRTAATHWGLMICVYCISHIPALMTLEIPGYAGRSPLLMVFLILIAQTSDVMQYVWGKLVGRHKIAPAVSPSKTVEGLAGGVLSATVLGGILWRTTPFSPWQSSLMAFLIAGLGFLGGFVMSAIKRDRGIKDWGNLIEGHGGMLDRMDSLCFSAPVFFHLVRYFFT